MKVIERVSNRYVVDLMHPSTDESYTEKLVNAGILKRTDSGK